MSNLHSSVKQKKREQQGREIEAGLNTDSYSEGYLEGYWGCEPSQVGNHSYWAGYQIGSREHWAKKLGVEIPT